jgi:hypothetical protein
MRERSLPKRDMRNVDEAIALARSFSAKGLVDLFRGQGGDWPISTTFQRFDSVGQQHEMARLGEFAKWIMAAPEMSSLHWDEDAILSVAQHYGIATPFLDVSTSPEVAAYFATTDAGGGACEADFGTIYCFKAANVDAMGRALARQPDWQHPDMLPFRVVKPHLRSLWRLEAQQGAFIDVRVDTNTFSDIDQWLCWPGRGSRRTCARRVPT